jgi:hypothetical protein
VLAGYQKTCHAPCEIVLLYRDMARASHLVRMRTSSSKDAGSVIAALPAFASSSKGFDEWS